MLGRTLNRLRQYADIGEIESSLRRSLELNCSLFEAADLLAMLLTEQRRYDDAAKIMLDIKKRMADPSPAQGRLAWIRRQRGQKAKAVTAIGNVLARLSMVWLGLEYPYGLACRRRRLGGNSSFTSRDPTVHVYKYVFPPETLVITGAGEHECEAIGSGMGEPVRDFPEDVSLHAIRYDILTKASQWQEAAAVLDAIEKVEPDNPFVLARRCEVLSHNKESDAVLEIALRICFLPVEENTWPSEKVWDIAHADMLADKLCQRFRQPLNSGNKPTLGSFSCMAAHSMRNTEKRSARSRMAIWFPTGGAREFKRLVGEISIAPWDSSKYRAIAYSLLVDYGYHRLVVNLSSKMNPASITVVNEWAQIGRAFVAGRLHAAGRKFLGSWRERTGVAMWMVGNYSLTLSCFRRDQLQERFNSACDALAGLPHDHCARYLAHIQAEACALLGNNSNFLDTWNSYARYFDARSKRKSISGARIATCLPAFLNWPTIS